MLKYLIGALAGMYIARKYPSQSTKITDTATTAFNQVKELIDSGKIQEAQSLVTSLAANAQSFAAPETSVQKTIAPQ